MKQASSLADHPQDADDHVGVRDQGDAGEHGRGDSLEGCAHCGLLGHILCARFTRGTTLTLYVWS